MSERGGVDNDREGFVAGDQRLPMTYRELVDSYEAEEGYPSEKWIEAFDALNGLAINWNDAADFLVNQLPKIAQTISCMQVIVTDAKDHIFEDKDIKRIEYITGGWSGAEDLIDVLLKQFWIRHYHSKWERGGYFVFEVDVDRLPQQNSEAGSPANGVSEQKRSLSTPSLVQGGK